MRGGKQQPTAADSQSIGNKTGESVTWDSRRKIPPSVLPGHYTNGRPSPVLVKSFQSSEGGVVKWQPTAANSQSIGNKTGELVTWDSRRKIPPSVLPGAFSQ